MEADWAAEVGSDLPSIDVPSEGFLDLRDEPSALAKIYEAASHPALREALFTLNSQQSTVFTAKCDAWKLTGPEIDPDEFGAHAEESREAVASYIDLLQRDPSRFASFEFQENWARSLTSHLRVTNQLNARVDLVIRPASINSSIGYGLTLYVAGCGADERAAYASWEAVLRTAVNATMSTGFTAPLRASSSIG
jgi:hypothetical protein